MQVLLIHPLIVLEYDANPLRFFGILFVVSHLILRCQFPSPQPSPKGRGSKSCGIRSSELANWAVSFKPSPSGRGLGEGSH